MLRCACASGSVWVSFRHLRAVRGVVPVLRVGRGSTMLRVARCVLVGCSCPCGAVRCGSGVLGVCTRSVCRVVLRGHTRVSLCLLRVGGCARIFLRVCRGGGALGPMRGVWGGRGCSCCPIGGCFGVPLGLLRLVHLPMRRHGARVGVRPMGGLCRRGGVRGGAIGFRHALRHTSHSLLHGGHVCWHFALVLLEREKLRVRYAQPLHFLRHVD